MAQSFEAQVARWVLGSQQRLDAVVKESTKRVIRIAQEPVARGGNMPVVTGNLRNSMVIELNNQPPGGRSSSTWETEAELKIAGAKGGDTIFAMWGAEYAIHVNYGTSRMAGRGFRDAAAAQWQQIVDQVVAELGGRIGV